MNRILGIFFLLFLAIGQLGAQVSPVEGAKLHYTLVGFSFPEMENVKKYTVEIAYGNHTSEKTFLKETIVKRASNTNKIVAEVPLFGAAYTWRVITTTMKGESKGAMRHFTTLPNPLADSNKIRLRVTKEATSYKDAHFFVDCSRALYDMSGRMLWFLPQEIAPEPDLKDMKLSVDGTITFVCGGRMHEITYDGKILNQMPANDLAVANLHHNGTKLKNGHYMVLGNAQVSWKTVGGALQIKHGPDSSGQYERAPFGTLNEYDAKGKLVWQFFSSDYFLQSDIAKWKPRARNPWQVHINAFYFDEEHNVIYIGFRNVSRILKVQYPEGNVIAAYGKLYKEGDLGNDLDQDLFCQQHAMIVKEGKMYLFNNNGCSDNPVPKIEILEEDLTALYGLKKVWEYESGIEVVKDMRSGGGNITDLPDGTIFASLSTPYSGVFIVDRQKKLIWNAVSENYDSTSQSWKALSTYRASIITDKSDLDKMIFYGH
jgi:hypothetical protein